jgi:hypothetical protein
MANNIDWGQGVNNNDIYWGQGAITNDISWGSVYSVSYSGETEILGNEIDAVIDFIARVTADSGTFEAKQCLINTIENI